MNRSSVLAMGAAIALTAGLVLVFGLAEPSNQMRTVPVADAVEPDWDMVRSTDTPAPDAPEETEVVYAAHDAMEIFGGGLDVSATTTTSLTTTTTTPRTTSTTRPASSPPTTAKPAPTTTTTKPTTTTTQPGAFRADLENDFLAEINSYRAANGLPALQRHSSLDTRARDWSRHMAGNNKLSHSNLANLLPPWSAAGENVGRGGSVTSLMNALINSPGHRANLLGDFTHVGLGVWRTADGTLWITQVFTR